MSPGFRFAWVWGPASMRCTTCTAFQNAVCMADRRPFDRSQYTHQSMPTDSSPRAVRLPANNAPGGFCIFHHRRVIGGAIQNQQHISKRIFHRRPPPARRLRRRADKRQLQFRTPRVKIPHIVHPVVRRLGRQVGIVHAESVRYPNPEISNWPIADRASAIAGQAYLGVVMALPPAGWPRGAECGRPCGAIFKPESKLYAAHFPKDHAILCAGALAVSARNALHSIVLAALTCNRRFESLHKPDPPSLRGVPLRSRSK